MNHEIYMLELESIQIHIPKHTQLYTYYFFI